jgi:O-antigen ligase
LNSSKPFLWLVTALGLSLVLYFGYLNLQYFSNISFLGAILLVEILVASLWKFEQRFLVVLILVFVWASLRIPLQGAGVIARWAVLFAGATVGSIIWSKSPHGSFRSMHLFAFFCVSAAFVSATVSPFIQMASLKALSLTLLFLYCSTGARLALVGREACFFQGLLCGIDIAVYITAICYLGFGMSVWGNPNSLGAAMSVACFPILLWGWIVSEGPVGNVRRLVALVLCTYLVRYSLARAGMVAVVVVTVVFCVCLHQYKLLMKVSALLLLLIAVAGTFAPQTLSKQLGDLTDAMLYKGHKEEGMLGSRRSPWDASISSIKAHPLFGTGYGTSPTGADPGLSFGTVNSSAETEREHGSSYITITEWVGLLGVLPFIAILAVTVSNVWRVCTWMRRTADPKHYSIPFAMVVLAGFVHATFEDWLFAVGSYLCLIFWVSAFLLADLVPGAVEIQSQAAVRSSSHPVPVDFGIVAVNR